MKKLENKIFYTIFILLSAFSLSLLFVFNYQDYMSSRKKVNDNLFRLDTNKDKPFKENFIGIEEKKEPMFMDTIIYTVELNGEEVKNIISHNEYSKNLDEIKSVATNIINKNEDTKIYIGNLYTNRYSYNYEKDVSIIIIDNAEVNEHLKSNLRLSLIIFVLLEFIIIFTSKKLTNWIIKPIIDAFNKQKRFIADASHELKTPIAVIMTSADSLEKNPKEKKWLNNIKDESERMNKLVKDLLELTRTENSKKQFNTIDLSKLVEKSILTLESLMYEKNIKLEYDITSNIKYNCDEDGIKQLLSILLDNAIKHSDKNGIIKVNLKYYKDSINLEVINKGNPIKKEDEQKIFERFYRSDESRNRNENRYGLGLAIAKNIVENHNGKIFAHSKDGYTIFTVVLKKK